MAHTHLQPPATPREQTSASCPRMLTCRLYWNAVAQEPHHKSGASSNNALSPAYCIFFLSIPSPRCSNCEISVSCAYSHRLRRCRARVWEMTMVLLICMCREHWRRRRRRRRRRSLFWSLGEALTRPLGDTVIHLAHSSPCPPALDPSSSPRLPWVFSRRRTRQLILKVGNYGAEREGDPRKQRRKRPFSSQRLAYNKARS